MTTLLTLPVMIPLATAALGLAAWKYPRVQGTCSVVGTAALLSAAVALYPPGGTHLARLELKMHFAPHQGGGTWKKKSETQRQRYCL